MGDSRFRVTGQLVRNATPVSAWMEVQDDDVFLHDFLASGRSRPDGTFSFELLRRSFNQQVWENEAVPDLVIFVWEGAPADEQPAMEDAPTHAIRLTDVAFDHPEVTLGPIELDHADRFGTGWLVRQWNTSRRPGGAWTLDEVRRLSNEVRTWVMRECRSVPPSRVTVELEVLEDAAGCYRPEDEAIVLDTDFIAQLGPDAVRRLLAHEWAHATAHHALFDVESAVDVRPTAALWHWVQEIQPLVPLSDTELVACVIKQAATANHEGYAHFVEERVVRRHLPLSGYPVQGMWARAHNEAADQCTDETLFRQWLAQHDAFALRHLGVAWYRHRYRGRGGRVKFHQAAGADLLEACMDRFARLVRGDGFAKRASRVEPWPDQGS